MNDQLQALVDIESLKSLKARYFRAMDTKDWKLLSSCFTDDLVADFRAAPGMMVRGRDEYVLQLTEILREATTVHHGHMPEITIVDANSASGVWSMEDIVKLPKLFVQGWGHYHETYRKEGGVWRISSIRLTRLRLLINGEEQNL